MEATIGKRSDFKRIERDCYNTPAEAVTPLLPFLPPYTRFVEPAAGAGALVRHLEAAGAGHRCVFACDIAPRGPDIAHGDMLNLKPGADANMVITNPPWERKLLHALILHLRSSGLPAWLLIDANWMFTAQAAPYLRYCERIITIGRLRWIPGTTMTGKDDCAWFLFMPPPVRTTTFHGRVKV
jgi:hypothetical protein